MNPREIDRVQIGSAEGKTYFTVVHLPQTEYGVDEAPRIQYDQYHLRTADSLPAAADNAEKEFIGYGFAPERFNNAFAFGEIHFNDDEVVLEVPLNSFGTCHNFNYWAAEGLVGEWFSNHEGVDFPKIRTDRKFTRNLFTGTLGDAYKAREFSDATLVEMLIDPEKPCTLMVGETYLQKKDAWQRALCRNATELSIMNYGHIWDRFTTYFEHQVTKDKFELFNGGKDKPERDRDMEARHQSQPRLPGIVVPTKRGNFREADKVSRRNFLYFDGTMEDVFLELLGAGVGIDDRVPLQNKLPK